MVVYPVDAYGRRYDVLRLTLNKRTNESAEQNNHSQGALYIFSPNNASVTIRAFDDSSDFTPAATSSSSSSFTSTSAAPSSISSSTVVINLNAFETHIHHIDTSQRHKLYSDEVFAVVLLQTNNTFSSSDSICLNVTLSLLDFVPPYYSARGKYFYLALPNVTDFRLFILGKYFTYFPIFTIRAQRR